MPEGNPEAYMEQGIPEEEAMAMAGMAPMDAMGAQMPMAPGNPDEMMLMLIEAVLGKWGSQDAQIAGEKDALMQVLAMLAESAPAPMDAGMAPVAPVGPSEALPAEAGMI